MAPFFKSPLIPNIFIVGHSQANVNSVKRALFDRFDKSDEKLSIYKNVRTFPGIKPGDSVLSSDSSIFWTPSLHGVIVKGRKQGCVKKHYGTPKAESPICRKNMAKRFLEILWPFLCDKVKKDEFNEKVQFISTSNMTYQTLKNYCLKLSPEYETLHKEMEIKLGLTSCLTKVPSDRNNFYVST